MATITVTVEGRLVQIFIDPVGPRLSLIATLWDTTNNREIRTFSEDVTGQLTANQLTALGNIVTKAQAWLDNKIANA